MMPTHKLTIQINYSHNIYTYRLAGYFVSYTRLDTDVQNDFTISYFMLIQH